MLELLTFIKERGFHLYKDGKWYSNYKRDWSRNQKFYSDEELFEHFKSESAEILENSIDSKVRKATDTHDLNGWEQHGYRIALKDFIKI